MESTSYGSLPQKTKNPTNFTTVNRQDHERQYNHSSSVLHHAVAILCHGRCLDVGRPFLSIDPKGILWSRRHPLRHALVVGQRLIWNLFVQHGGDTVDHFKKISKVCPETNSHSHSLPSRPSRNGFRYRKFAGGWVLCLVAVAEISPSTVGVLYLYQLVRFGPVPLSISWVLRYPEVPSFLQQEGLAHPRCVYDGPARSCVRRTQCGSDVHHLTACTWRNGRVGSLTRYRVGHSVG